jgi:hypothetical protein
MRAHLLSLTCSWTVHFHSTIDDYHFFITATLLIFASLIFVLFIFVEHSTTPSRSPSYRDRRPPLPPPTEATTVPPTTVPPTTVPPTTVPPTTAPPTTGKCYNLFATFFLQRRYAQMQILSVAV